MLCHTLVHARQMNILSLSNTSAHMLSVHHVCAWSWQTPREGIEPPRPGVQMVVSLCISTMWVLSGTQVLWTAMSTLNHWAIHLSRPSFYFERRFNLSRLTLNTLCSRPDRFWIYNLSASTSRVAVNTDLPFPLPIWVPGGYGYTQPSVPWCTSLATLNFL